MDAIWTALGLEPTKDVSAIKRAYAEKAKTCHPEEDPEGFLSCGRPIRRRWPGRKRGKLLPPLDRRRSRRRNPRRRTRAGR